MAAFTLTSTMPLVGAAWTGTAPGLPGTQTVAGTITSTSDLSVYTRNVGVNLAAATGKTTNMGSGGYETNLTSIKSGTVTFQFNQDFAAALHVIINTTIGGLGALAYVDLKATSAARGAGNPSFVAAFFITTYTPVMGSTGDVATIDVTWPLNGAFAFLTA